jgi:glycosyltransferase involved in cell wall biosynthesis
MTKVAVSYRVLQGWRIPVFQRLASFEDIDLTVLYGEDFEGSKVRSAPAPSSFDSKCLPSLNFRLFTSNGKAFVPFCPSLFGELRRLKPDIIITEGASNFINNITCFVFAKLYGCKIIQWGLGEIQGRKVSIHRKILNIAFNFVERNSDGAISYSTIGANYYKRIGIPENRVFTAVNVVDTEARFEEMQTFCKTNSLSMPSPAPKLFNILFVGAITFGKQIELLIEAYHRFTMKNPSNDHRLTIVGDGDQLASIKALVKNYELVNRVTFAGHISSGISRYFYEASIFVLPGLGGLAVSDALIHGVPVICTVGDGCERDLVSDGNNGFFIQKMSVDILADQLDALFHNKSSLEKLRKGAQSFRDGPYSIDSYVKNIKASIDACTQ